MWKFTEVNAITNNLIYFLHILTCSLTIWATVFFITAHHLKWLTLTTTAIPTCRNHIVVNFLSNVSETSALIRKLVIVRSLWCSLTQLHLAVFAEKFVAISALHWLVWELTTDDANDLLDHLSLKLVLNFVHFDVQRWHWLGTHQVLNLTLGKHKGLTLLERKTLLFGVHFLLQRMVLPLRWVHNLNWHYLGVFKNFIY